MPNLTKREMEKLLSRIDLLERDLKQARALLLPNQIAVYRAAMRWYKIRAGDGPGWGPLQLELYRACERAAKVQK